MTEAGWQELRFATTPEKVAELEDWLFQHGALAVTLEDDADEPLLEPGPGETPLWQAIRLVGLFGQEADLKALVDGVPDHLLADPGVQTEQVPDRDWERVWMDEFKPMKLGRRLWICPSWCEPPDPAAVNINLDPGLGSAPVPVLLLRFAWGNSMGSAGDDRGGMAVDPAFRHRRPAGAARAPWNDPQAITATTENRLHDVPAEY